MASSDPLLNVRDLMTLADGSFVEPGFVAVVASLEPAQGKKPMRAQLVDVDGGDTISSALWSRPRILQGQTVEFSGKGIIIKEFHNQPEVNINRETDVRVVGGGIPRNSVGAGARRTAGPRDDTRGADPEPARGPAQSDFNTDPDPKTIAENNAANFHLGMRRQALLLAHCWIYSRRLFQKLQDQCGFVFDKSQEEAWIRATVHGLHIEANRKGLDGIVCNLDVPPPAPKAKTAPPRQDPPPAPPPAAARDQTRNPERFQDDPAADLEF